MTTAYIIGTFDTKGTELDYVAELVRAAGVPVCTVDISTTAASTVYKASTESSAHIEPGTVAAAHPGGPDAVFTGDRGSAVAEMAVALAAWLPAQPVGGVLGLGGSGGTALITPAMRALAVGVPKIMVSTVASGDVSAYVAGSDIAMLHSVTDVAGLNRISRQVLGNAAHALAGACLHPVPVHDDRTAIGLTMFGVTTPCVQAVSTALAERFDPLVFHATGTGGMAMEKLVDDRLIGGVLDISTTEVCDHIAGGVLSAGETRMDAIARTGVPYVGSCGALDMVNFGAMDTVPTMYTERTLYPHNPQITLMRTDVEECTRIAEFIAGKLNACSGPVRFLLPTGGVSALDAPGQPFHHPEADAALFGTLERAVRQNTDRRVIRSRHHINDPEFATELLALFDEVI